MVDSKSIEIEDLDRDFESLQTDPVHFNTGGDNIQTTQESLGEIHEAIAGQMKSVIEQDKTHAQGKSDPKTH